MTKPVWPLQSQCKAFYGDPTSVIRGAPAPNAEWERMHLVKVFIPWSAHASWDKDLRIRTLRVHSKCAASLERVLNAIWEAVGRDQNEIDRIGMSSVGGGHNWRLMRGGNALSTHSYGCAVDFDPERNGLGDNSPAMDKRVIKAFTDEGWVWGGQWKRPDGMHFQAARVD
ncbi:M15 family metallopeptidase [Asticcacaulis sp. ZE23SCel15]|uniref:M15 family metallopeptidase n=1 Tax=Asticcacaulis sp. ZE23SCel15 TaxID=3059027 RepID=UPI00265F9D9C|nr:M15 family metallopeptidase [Asticcacaulis sp. ZE23SCel15]WKL57223.1 M15 family metallopeptidase [Asticcacaulis sp. ZE23SCel15]